MVLTVVILHIGQGYIRLVKSETGGNENRIPAAFVDSMKKLKGV